MPTRTRPANRLSEPRPAEQDDRAPSAPHEAPLSFIKDKRKRLIAAKQLSLDSISWALNAQLEVADYRDRELCHQRATILHALAVAKSPSELTPLLRAASKLLVSRGQRPIVPGKVYDVDGASDVETRRRFLEKTREFLLPQLKAGERAIDGVRSYDAVLKAAKSSQPSHNTRRRRRAESVAEALISELYLDAGYAALHPRPLRAADLGGAKQRTARAIEFLMEHERATPVNVAFVTLFLLGRPARDRRNFFSATVTDPIADVGASLRLTPP